MNIRWFSVRTLRLYCFTLHVADFSRWKQDFIAKSARHEFVTRCVKFNFLRFWRLNCRLVYNLGAITLSIFADCINNRNKFVGTNWFSQRYFTDCYVILLIEPTVMRAAFQWKIHWPYCREQNLKLHIKVKHGSVSDNMFRILCLNIIETGDDSTRKRRTTKNRRRGMKCARSSFSRRHPATHRGH